MSEPLVVQCFIANRRPTIKTPELKPFATALKALTFSTEESAFVCHLSTHTLK